MYWYCITGDCLGTVLAYWFGLPVGPRGTGEPVWLCVLVAGAVSTGRGGVECSGTYVLGGGVAGGGWGERACERLMESDCARDGGTVGAWWWGEERVASKRSPVSTLVGT